MSNFLNSIILKYVSMLIRFLIGCFLHLVIKMQKIYSVMVEFAEVVEIAVSLMWLSLREICGIVLMTIQSAGYFGGGNKNKQKIE